MLLAILYLPQGLDFIEALTKNIKMSIILKFKNLLINENLIKSNLGFFIKKD